MARQLEEVSASECGWRKQQQLAVEEALVDQNATHARLLAHLKVVSSMEV